MSGAYDARSGIAALIENQRPGPALPRAPAMPNRPPQPQTPAADPSKIADAFRQGRGAREVIDRWTRPSRRGQGPDGQPNQPTQSPQGDPAPVPQVQQEPLGPLDASGPMPDAAAAAPATDAAGAAGGIGNVAAATEPAFMNLASTGIEGAGAAGEAALAGADAVGGAGLGAADLGIGAAADLGAGAAEAGAGGLLESAPWLLALLALADGGVADTPHVRNVGAGVRGGRSHFTRRGGGLFRGAVKGQTPGRADARNFSVGRGSYVVPADVVSALGQGNTDAGHKILQGAVTGRNPITGFADGGQVAEAVPVRLSDGEFVFAPQEVHTIGGPEKLDAMVHSVRAHTAAALRKMPPPR